MFIVANPPILGGRLPQNQGDSLLTFGRSMLHTKQNYLYLFEKWTKLLQTLNFSYFPD